MKPETTCSFHLFYISSCFSFIYSAVYSISCISTWSAINWRMIKTELLLPHEKLFTTHHVMRCDFCTARLVYQHVELNKNHKITQLFLYHCITNVCFLKWSNFTKPYSKKQIWKSAKKRRLRGKGCDKLKLFLKAIKPKFNL